MAITWKNFDINNVNFEKVKTITTTAEIKYQRIFLKYKYDDGTIGKYLLGLQRCIRMGFKRIDLRKRIR